MTPPLRLRTRTTSIAIVLVALVGCDRLMGADDDAMEDPPRLVVVQSVVRDDAIDRVTILGDLRGEQQVRVFSSVPERIRILHVAEGDAVQAGDPIVTLQSGLQSSSLEQASAAMGAAEAARDQLSADLDRARGLVARGALPQQQIDTLEAQLRTANAQLDQSRAVRRTASQQRGRTVVRAPIAGTVALLAVERGDMVSPTIPICSVVQAERLTLRLRVTEQDYVRVEEGMQVEVRPPALPDLVRMGTVRQILGMLPLSVGAGDGAETWAPMARAVVGGMAVGTLLTLFVIPILYTMVAGFRDRWRARRDPPDLRDAEPEAA